MKRPSTRRRIASLISRLISLSCRIRRCARTTCWTGATGFIGTAVVRELQGAGHDVLGLARSDKAAEALAQQSVKVHRGDLSDTDCLAEGARSCDGVIHLGFNHDFSKFQENIAVDRKAVQSMAEALHGSNKPLVIASGVLLSSG